MERRRRPPALLRRSSLISIRPVAEEDHIDGATEGDGGAAELRSIEEWCTRTAARCVSHEQEITNLKHTINERLSRWDSTITMLQKLEDRAQGLSDQIRSTLESFRSTTGAQILSAKSATMNVHERVGQSREDLNHAVETIDEAHKAIDSLETRMLGEEVILKQVAFYSQVLLGMSLTGAALLLFLVIWFRY